MRLVIRTSYGAASVDTKSLQTPSALTPQAGDALAFSEATYTFAPHPLLPASSGEPYAMEGAEAVVYQMRRQPDGALFALKAPKPAYRSPRAIAVTAALARLADEATHEATSGFAAARRVCLTRGAHPDALARWPAFEYATLMPWLTGRNWSSMLLDRQASQAYTAEQALALATSLATALRRLETIGGAHTDLAGDNLILTADGLGVELIDLEGVYLPGLPRPPRVSQGTAGYQPRFLAHPLIAKGWRWPWRHRATAPTDDLWRPDGDRFAAAILLTELLTWADANVRAATPIGAESLFQPDELGWAPSGVARAERRTKGAGDATPDGARLAAVWGALRAIHPPLLALLERAWAARGLGDCPAIGEWAQALAH